ncbi:hypothetical protein CERZMDRAFT_95337 [Cercospora zeae-maydis SCOH1-5]|uniref:Uncharacterized protein n=1 Tax=Cercospora zeae-maydis SCOH1-5 TaxID=717836 RepID=A0A6A6FNI3_9PEZI|nr:hypothetical protein CERZMDRAFT_95337 [Cercospora zeae-maydis SCOH1-5]
MAHVNTETLQSQLYDAQFVLTIYQKRLRCTQAKIADLSDLHEAQIAALWCGTTPLTLVRAVSLRASLDAANHQAILDTRNLREQKRLLAALQARVASSRDQLSEESDDEDESYLDDDDDDKNSASSPVFRVPAAALELLYEGVKTLGRYLWK